MKPNRPDPAGVAGVCFALAGLIAIVAQIFALVK
jgi:hypothetical protein